MQDQDIPLGPIEPKTLTYKKSFYTQLEDGWYDIIEKLHLTKLTDAIDKVVPSFPLFLVIVALIIICLIVAGVLLLIPQTANVAITFYQDEIQIGDDLNIRIEYLDQNEFVIVESGEHKQKFKIGEVIKIQVYTLDYETDEKSFLIEKDTRTIKVNVPKKQVLPPEKITVSIKDASGMPFSTPVQVKLKCSGSNTETTINVTQSYETDKEPNCGAVSASATLLGFVSIVNQSCPNNTCSLVMTREGGQPNEEPIRNDLVVVVYDSEGKSTSGKQISIIISQGSVTQIQRQDVTTVGTIKFDQLELGQYIVSASDLESGANASKTINLVAGNAMTVDLNLSEVVDGNMSIDVNISSEDGNACTANIFLYDYNSEYLATYSGTCGKSTHIPIADYNTYSVTVMPSADYKLRYKSYLSDELEITSSNKHEKVNAKLELYDFKEDTMIRAIVEDDVGPLTGGVDALVMIKNSKGKEVAPAEKINDKGIAEFVVGPGEYKLTVVNKYLEGESEDFDIEAPEDNEKEELVVVEQEVFVEWLNAEITVHLQNMVVSCDEDEEDCIEELENVEIAVIFLSGNEPSYNIEYPDEDELADCSEPEQKCVFNEIKAGRYAYVSVTATDRMTYVSPVYFLEGAKYKKYDITAKLYRPEQFSDGFAELYGIYNNEDCNAKIYIVSKGTYYYCSDILINDDSTVYYEGKNSTIKKVYHSGTNVDDLEGKGIKYSGIEYPFISTAVFATEISIPSSYDLEDKYYVGVKLSKDEETENLQVNLNQRLFCDATKCLDTFVNKTLESNENVYITESIPAYVRAYNEGDFGFGYKLFSAPNNTINAPTNLFTFDGNTKGYTGVIFNDVDNDHNYIFLQRKGKVIFDGAESKSVNFKVYNTSWSTVNFVNKNQFTVEGLPVAVGKDYNTTISFTLKDLDNKKVTGDVNLEILGSKGKFLANNTSKIKLSSSSGNYDVNINLTAQGQVQIQFKKAGYVTKTVIIISDNMGFYEAPVNYITVPIPVEGSITKDFEQEIDLNIRNLTNEDVEISNIAAGISAGTILTSFYFRAYDAYEQIKSFDIFDQSAGIYTDIEFTATNNLLEANTEKLSIKLRIPKSNLESFKVSGAKYYPVLVDLLLAKGTLYFRIPIILELVPEISVIDEEKRAVKCYNTKITATKDDAPLEQIYLDLNTPAISGELHIENNNADLQCDPNNESIKAYKVIVNYITNNFEDDETNIPVVSILKTTKNLEKIQQGAYAEFTINKSDIDSIPFTIYGSTQGNYTTGIIFFEVRPIFSYGNIVKEEFLLGESKQIYFSGVHLSNPSSGPFVSAYAFSPLINQERFLDYDGLVVQSGLNQVDENHHYYLEHNRPSVYSVSFFSGDIAQCVSYDLDLSYPSGYNTTAFINFRPEKFINYEFGPNQEINITNKCGIALTSEMNTIFDSSSTFITNISIPEYTTNTSFPIPQLVKGLEIGAETLEIITRTAIAPNKILKNYYYLNDVVLAGNNHYVFSDSYIVNKNIPAQIYSLGQPGQWVKDNVFPNGLPVAATSEELDALPGLLQWPPSIKLNLCTSDESCYDTLKPYSENESYCDFGGQKGLETNISFSSDGLDCEDNYCSLLQFSRYVQSKMQGDTLNISMIKDKYVYLLEDDYTTLYKSEFGDWSSLIEPINNVRMYGRKNFSEKIPIGILGSGKYKLFVIQDPTTQEYQIYPVYHQGARPSIFYQMPYDGLGAGEGSVNYGTALLPKGNVTFSFNNNLANPAYYPDVEEKVRVNYNLFLNDTYDETLEGYTVFKYTPGKGIYVASNKCFDNCERPKECESDETKEFDSLEEITTALQQEDLCYLVNPYDNSEIVYYQPTAQNLCEQLEEVPEAETP